MDVAGAPLTVSASIGVASYPHDGTTYGDLLRHSDLAMYEAKAHGRNTCRAYASDDPHDVSRAS
jgi:diguanylate cyclase (GGDEF)-like protein